MTTTPFIIALTGPSSCGKTYVTDKILDLGKHLNQEGIAFYPKRFFKYVTRPYREIEVVDRNKGRAIDVESVRSIPDDCELVYRTYGEEYGLRIADLRHMLDQHVSPIIVINDVRVVEELKKEFRAQVLSVFIFREIIPDVETHKNSGATRGSGSERQSITRFEKAVALYRVFIENIFVFDRVILNVEHKRPQTGGGEADNIVHLQTENLVRGVLDGRIALGRTRKKSPKLFIISGNAASGKDDIIKAANRMGRLQADILRKHTSRWQEPDDENEIVCRYKPNTSLMAKYNADYESELLALEESCILDDYLAEHESDCQESYDRKDDQFCEHCTFDEFCRAKFTIYKLERTKKIATGIERFWAEIRCKQEEGSIPAAPGSPRSELPEAEYKEIRDAYFEQDPCCLDLASLKWQRPAEVDTGEDDELVGTRNDSFLLRHDGRDYILYGNNSLYDEPVDYGFEVGNLRDTWEAREKHLVLTASLPSIFKMCRRIFGPENVVTAFTYSQIGQQEHLKHSEKVMGQAKLKEYEDIRRYANHIVEFDYALIYAETSLSNKTGNQKSELVDQMFRLFRAYSE